MDWGYLNKFVLGTIRGGLFFYILIKNGYKSDSNYYNAFFYTLFFFHPYPPRAS